MKNFRLTVLALAVAVCTASTSSADAPPSLDKVFQTLGFSQKDIEAVKKGQIVSTEPKRTRDDQLIAAVAVPIKASVSALTEGLKTGRNISVDSDVLSHGKIDTSSSDPLAAFTFKDSKEIGKLLSSDRAKNFHLSSDEQAMLKKRLAGLNANQAGSSEKAMAAYREVLAGRLEAYAKRGLDGVAPYVDGSETLSPVATLRAATSQARPFLSKHFPSFWAALNGFPKDGSQAITSDLYWVDRKVEGRPAALLVHHLYEATDDYLMVSQRQYYVGHTYESLQMFGLAMPTETGVVIFSVNSIFTEQITGFFSGVAQSVGEKRTKESMIKHFEAVRKEVQ